MKNGLPQQLEDEFRKVSKEIMLKYLAMNKSYMKLNRIVGTMDFAFRLAMQDVVREKRKEVLKNG